MNSLIKVKVEGKKVSNYIKWLVKEKINIYFLNIIDVSNLELVIDYKELNKIKTYSRTYKITIIKKYGKLRIIELIKNNIYIYLSIIFSIFFLYFLSNIIFNIKVIYNDQYLQKKLIKELEKYDIKKYKLKKNNKYLREVENKILKDNSDILEWITIEEYGTTYNIRIVERKIEPKKNEYKYQSVVSSKEGTIKSIEAYNGEVLKEKGEYVKKEEVIISGALEKTNGEIVYNKAIGKVLGEIWYKVKVEYPLYYQEEKVTGNNKNILVLNFINKRFPILPYKKYKQFKIEKHSILENIIFPINISKEKVYEVILKEEIYTEEEATNKCYDLIKKKMKENNPKIIEINQIEILKKKNMNSKIELELFVSVTEDITKIIEIKEENHN